MSENDNIKKDEKKDEKWDFSDYAYTITGILVGVLLVGPELLESIFNISILGGSLSGVTEMLNEGLGDDGGLILQGFSQLRALSPMLFLLTTTICFFQEAIVARKSGGYTGSMFTHTFESLLEDAIYMAITTFMVYSAVLFGAMYTSWLAGPITWILFMFIFPLVRQKSGNADEDFSAPWLLLFIFAIGIIAEVITGAWIAFPLSWLIICAFKLVDTIREKINTIDDVFNALYYAFSVILMAAGIALNFWITSWIAFPIALIICWILSKFGRFKKVKASE